MKKVYLLNDGNLQLYYEKENNEYNIFMSKTLMNKIIDGMSEDKMYEYGGELTDTIEKQKNENKEIIKFGSSIFHQLIEIFRQEVCGFCSSFFENEKEDVETLRKEAHNFCLNYLYREINDYYLNDLSEFLIIGFKLRDAYREYHFKRTLNKDFNKIMENLKDICSEEEYKYFYTIFQNQSYDFNDKKKALNLANEKIKTVWLNDITKISDFKNGDIFKFICHSTYSTKWDIDKLKNFYSCSLITNNIMDTYNAGFGFIMSAEDVVGASSWDMFISNNALSENGVFGPVKNIIETPNYIEKKVSTRKSEDSYYNNKHYSEVVVKGFNPIGIFCLTNGSKNDIDYLSALKLKEQFPNLPLVEINQKFYMDDKKDKKHLKMNL